jgi:hypothetical protein
MLCDEWIASDPPDTQLLLPTPHRARPVEIEGVNPQAGAWHIVFVVAK